MILESAETSKDVLCNENEILETIWNWNNENLYSIHIETQGKWRNKLIAKFSGISVYAMG